MIQDFFLKGRVVDVILLVLALEFAILCWRRTGGDRRAAALDLIFAMAPGACLLLALRAALTGAGWAWIALALAASFPVHLADLMRRRL